MQKHTIQQCRQCGQKLRFPVNMGGMLMACPNCGQKFQSDFKLKGCNKKQIFQIYEEYTTGFLPRLKRTLSSIFSCWFKK